LRRRSGSWALEIATVSGRFYAMDRDNIWDRVALAYDALTLGEGVTASSAVEAMERSYENGETDEFVRPTVIVRDGRPTGVISPGDAVVFFNFRPDRARQLTRSYIDPQFTGFERKKASSAVLRHHDHVRRRLYGRPCGL
jgi:2,3-bisphosphoglycerate-independent phosphoglycerate mutase